MEHLDYTSEDDPKKKIRVDTPEGVDLILEGKVPKPLQGMLNEAIVKKGGLKISEEQIAHMMEPNTTFPYPREDRGKRIPMSPMIPISLVAMIIGWTFGAVFLLPSLSTIFLRVASQTFVIPNAPTGPMTVSLLFAAIGLSLIMAPVALFVFGVRSWLAAPRIGTPITMPTTTAFLAFPVALLALIVLPVLFVIATLLWRLDSLNSALITSGLAIAALVGSVGFTMRAALITNDPTSHMHFMHSLWVNVLAVLIALGLSVALWLLV